ncbi:formimidoylglutamase [Aminiphilus sp.]|jgi:formimidoylglutamase|uniref:formimidoylglutamase n=1 Tax=Aminiphilus sp. TaxID=1872488 RepID=UPI00261A8CCF|nr:formimidoylglutamase [Aminiphilus sp.]
MSFTLLPPRPEWFFSRNDPNDPRLGDIVRPVTGGPDQVPSETRIALLGFPEDRGIAQGGGKAGAAGGPDAIRRVFYRLTPGFGGHFHDLAMVDLGDVPPGDTLEESHERLAVTVRALLERDIFPLVLGGGHDLTFSGLVGVVTALDLREGELGVINVDSHLDVRDLRRGITSGTPFRRALEALPHRALLGRSFVEFGIQEPFNSPHYHQWVKERDVTVMTLASIGNRPLEFFLEALRIAGEGTRAIALSIDIDAVRSHEAPGASASNPRGLKAPELEKIAYLAGRTEHIRYMDLVEMCPPLDEHHRTASLCAGVLFWFCKGFGERRGLRAPRRRAEE